VRDDVRAKLRSSIKRLLVKHGYPPDQQPAAIKLVMEQMESMAPRFADERPRKGPTSLCAASRPRDREVAPEMGPHVAAFVPRG